MSDLNYDYQRYAVLFVDDEEKTRKYFRRLYGETFRILEASFQLRIPRMFAALALISACGIAIFALLGAVQHLLLRRWHESALRDEG